MVFDNIVVFTDNDEAGTADNMINGIENPDNKYLNQRRLKTKAKFDVYFSVRTAADQYAERQNILKNVKWEEYDKLRKDFNIFSDLG